MHEYDESQIVSIVTMDKKKSGNEKEINLKLGEQLKLPRKYSRPVIDKVKGERYGMEYTSVGQIDSSNMLVYTPELNDLFFIRAIFSKRKNDEVYGTFLMTKDGLKNISDSEVDKLLSERKRIENVRNEFFNTNRLSKI